jgi:hypothetical protein
MIDYLLILNFCKIGHVYITAFIEGRIKKRMILKSQNLVKNQTMR